MPWVGDSRPSPSGRYSGGLVDGPIYSAGTVPALGGGKRLTVSARTSEQIAELSSFTGVRGVERAGLENDIESGKRNVTAGAHCARAGRVISRALLEPLCRAPYP